MATPHAIHFTGDAEADAFLGESPLALLIGFVLDQQVTVPTAFAGPLEAEAAARPSRRRRDRRHRPGPSSRRSSARARDPSLPGNMAKRVQELCAVVAEEYGGDAPRVWRERRRQRD